MSDNRAIGVFDSGLGGLSVLKAIRDRLPGEDLLYVADSAYLPYGGKPADLLRKRALTLGDFLQAQGAKAIVIACNTATAAAAAYLRDALELPVVAMEPAVKPATASTRNGVVGVLATSGTLESARFAALLARFGQGVQVLTQPCPGLPERVEAGDTAGPETLALLRRYTAPLVAAGADVLVLGCTHYVFLKDALRELLGPEVQLIETGPAVAQQLERVLVTQNLLSSAREGNERMWTSGDLGEVARAVGLLWPRPVQVERLEKI